MASKKNIRLALLFMRVTVFLVMFMWTLDKFVRPKHAMGIFSMFYRLPALGAAVSYTVGTLEMVLIIGFLVGYRKQWTYGLVMLLHAVSTLSTCQQYLDPFTGPHLLFFAAWPMLAACWALFVMRDDDTLLTVKG